MIEKLRRYAVRSTPGGLVVDDSSGNVIYLNSYAEAEAEALRLTREARNNPHLQGVTYTPVEIIIQ